MQLGKTGFIQLHLFQRCIDNSGIGAGGCPFLTLLPSVRNGHLLAISQHNIQSTTFQNAHLLLEVCIT